MRNIKLAAIVQLLWSVAVMATLSNVYNIATPQGQDDPRNADDEMRLIKAAIQERMNDHNGTTSEGDHYWPLDGTLTTQVKDNDTGQHRMVTLRQLTVNPSALDSYSSIANLGFLYQKDVSSNGELFWEDEAANVIQITIAGLFNLQLGAIWDGVFKTSTSDAGDSKSISLTAGGAYGASRGAGIILYGNQHANKGQLVLEAGYTDDPNNTVKAIIDAKTSKISNVADPAAAQDVATKAYVDAELTPNPMTGTTDSNGEIVLGNGFVMKWGVKTFTALQEVAVDFTDEGLTDFDTACFQAFICYGTAGTSEFSGAVSSLSVSAITIKNGSDESRVIRWFAIGR